MNLRTPLFFAKTKMALGLSVLLSTSGFAQEPKPNFLIITIDDLKNVVGVLADEPGNFLATIYEDANTRAEIKEILTPNIDQLISESVLFDDAHTIYPICNPSRIALWTGTRPLDTGFDTNNLANFRTHPNGVNLVTMQQNLRENGYFTTGLGKVFHSPRGGTDNEFSWDAWINRPQGARGPWIHSYYSANNLEFPFGRSPFSMDEQYDIENADHASRLMLNGNSTIEEAFSGNEKSVKLPSDAPFLVQLGIYLPHSPFVAPQEALDLINVEDMSLDREKLDAIYADLGDLSSGGRFYANTNFRASSFAGSFSQIIKGGLRKNRDNGDIEAWREVVRHYLASVIVADRAVGRVMQALDDGPYSDNTVVVLHTDHGYNLGEKNVIGKNVLWDDSTRSILMIRNPGTAPAVIDETVSLQDIYPTVSSLAGIPVPDYVSYSDLTPFLQNENTVSTKPILSVQGRRAAKRYAAITERYLYLRFGNNAKNVELYDRYVDPDQLVNLATLPEHQTTRQTLNTVLDQLVANVDAPPVIMPLINQVANTGTPIYQPVTAWHAQGDSLTYEATALPPGVALDPITGILHGSPLVAGTYTSTIFVSSTGFTSSIETGWAVSGPTAIDTQAPYWENPQLEAQSIATDRMVISWSGSIDNVEVVSWNVYLDNSLIGNVNENTFSIEEISPDTEYSLRIEALDFAEQESTDGPTANFKTIAVDNIAPLWATDAIVGISDVTSDKLSVNWPSAQDDVRVAYYQVVVNGMSHSTVTQLNTSIQNLVPNTEYTIEISAVDTSGNLSSERLTAAATTSSPDPISIEEGAVLITVNGSPVSATLSNFGSTRDLGTAAISDDATTVDLNGNRWSKLSVNYLVTRDTVLAFDYASDARGETQGIGFGNKTYASSSRIFKLFGAHRFGKSNYNDYATYAPAVRRYEIPVGQFYRGLYSNLILMNDHDRAPANAHSRFSNIEIYEQEN